MEKRVLGWTSASVCSGLVLYAIIPNLPNLWVNEPYGSRLAFFGAGALMLGYFGVLFSAMAIVPCYFLFMTWASLARRFSVLERTSLHLATFMGLLAISAAIPVVGLANGGLDVAGITVLAAIFWGAFLWPRFCFRGLKPGVFTSV